MEAIHALGNGQRGGAQAAIAGLLLLAALAGCSSGAETERAAVGAVRPGIEVLLSDSLQLIRGRRLGLITNHTGIGRDGTPDVELLRALPPAEQVELATLFTPEHGYRGALEGPVPDRQRDAGTGLRVYSLYGDTREPTPAMLRGLDVLLFDLQDIGARYYTYIWTMALAMKASAAAGIPFVVLDRPNPLGGLAVQGDISDLAHASFVGLYPIPMRHGMTPGELARLFNARFRIGAELHVVPLEGWRRDWWFDQTGLPWVAPSPNMPSLESAAHYPGTCLFEGTNLSVGRGTARPFQQIGAPWLEAEALARRLQALRLPGVRFETVEFTPRAPSDGKFDGRRVRAVRFIVTDRSRYDPTLAGTAALLEARRLAGARWRWNARHFDRLAGNSVLRAWIDEGRPLARILDAWAGRVEVFRRLRKRYLLY
ncbi:MAG: exo-beta-N-acetylmuramidase NamZ domain-containing protein [Gemmatimonadota bacterium]